jgi:hypothetical protein
MKTLLDPKYRIWLYLVIGLVFMVGALGFASYQAQSAGCSARWGETYKHVKYSAMTGCLVEYPAGSGTMVPESAIRLNEPAKPTLEEQPK